MPKRLRYPATSRNREVILEVLRGCLPPQGLVLELASGSGEHAVTFAAALPGLRWQPTDPELAARESIAAWTEHEGLSNVAAPLDLDATRWPWPVTEADAIVCINMIHIAPWDATLGLLAGAGQVLGNGAPLLLYGPYYVDGQTAPSNVAFDQSLRSRNATWGVRELSEIEREAKPHGLTLASVVQMPANNLCVEFRKQDGASS
ncbi:MAG: DUF938 domain-containing protein [Myxococcota bacterium]